MTVIIGNIAIWTIKQTPHLTENAADPDYYFLFFTVKLLMIVTAAFSLNYRSPLVRQANSIYKV
ncbi:hypothetical protein [Paenibacillus violae]|uniref:hypothetical protein n=1 Tax=Paenibacillus violae TaxID=3077234 RepID=UPI0028FC1580|nr:hypothetical protein [Paenibacillus sp. PFR10]